MEASARYVRGRLSVAELDAEVDQFWDELQSSPTLQSEVERLGVNPSELLEIPPSVAVRIVPVGAGTDPSLVELLVAFAPIANHLVKSTWDNVILPWIKRRRGDDSIGPPTDIAASE